MNLLTYKNHQDFFNSKAESWEIIQDQINFIQKIFEQIQFTGSETVLDIGCGTGNLFKYIKGYVPYGKIIGIDFAINMLRKSRDNLSDNTYITQSLAEQLPIRSSSTDIILNYCLYPHIKYKQTALREFYRILKPGCRYFIIHPQGSHEVNCLHNKIGGPVCFDFIEPIDFVIKMLELTQFKVKTAVDKSEIFFIEAVKI